MIQGEASTRSEGYPGERADCVPGLISVLVPVRDLRGTVGRCVRSILAQTYEDIEVIAVDDGSADGTGELLDALAAREPRVRALRQGRLGVSAARNAALRAARGEWVAFVDADDWVEPGHLEGLLSAARKYHARFAYCGFVEHRGGRLVRCSAESLDVPNRAALLTMEDADFNTALWNKLIHRDLVYGEEPLLFDDGLSLGEDLAWLAEVLLRVDFAVRVPQETYHWCRRVGSLTHGTDRATLESDMRAKVSALRKIPGDYPVARSCIRRRLVNNLIEFVFRDDLGPGEALFYRRELRRQARELGVYSLRDALRKGKLRLATLMIMAGLPRGAVDAVRSLGWPLARRG